MSTGNRLTDNALFADDGKELIERGIKEIESELGWKICDEKPLFSGRFYDSKKVGSFIARVVNPKGEFAVLKLQLRPLPYDEGMIMRHISPQIKTDLVRLPKLYADEAWNEKRGYGYLITEDASEFPRLWKDHCPTGEEIKTHERFLDVFMHQVLPIEPFLPKPEVSVKEKYKEAFDHFYEIAAASSHRHIEQKKIEEMKNSYFEVLEQTEFGEFHFTHAHLSGMEIRIDPKDGAFILFSNLLWSFRPKYYEVVFPIWVDCMGIRNVDVKSEDLLVRIDRWSDLWSHVMGEDPRKDPLFHFLILERAMMTVMLDLGASEWSENEAREKAALLEAWKGIFEKTRSQFQNIKPPLLE